MNAQISFLEGTFSLIHIPLDLYTVFLQPILQILLPHRGRGCLANPATGPSVDNKHGFLNISITPVECSVVCHSSWAKSVFEPVIRSRLSRDASKSVTISKDTYLVLSVISAGMDAASRINELTSPLALAGIPIFFITTYYSDFILVPSKDRKTVVEALLARNFEFVEDESAFVSPTAMYHARGRSQSSDPPSTPPPSSVAELQARTFELLRRRNVVPYICPGLSLVQCAGRDIAELVGYGDYVLPHHPRSAPSRPDTFSGNGNGNGNGNDNSDYGDGDHGEEEEGDDDDDDGSSSDDDSSSGWLDQVDARLYASLASVLAAQPRFLSVTLAPGDPPSLLLDRRLLRAFGGALVVADVEGDLTPIFLDLASLPLEATGIVSGVAGRLVDELRSTPTTTTSTSTTAAVGGGVGGGGVGVGVGMGMGVGVGGGSSELSYLSTARAGAVILPHEQSLRALEIMKPLLSKT
ncbi:ACT domain-containing protein [Xylariaceae sp. FL0804]|nr:ACT domain-containing protein [Xylariaceae sp. FL0804]